MSSSAAGQPRCRVIGGEMLPPASGGADAICAAIEQVASARSPGVGYSVEVRVLSPSLLVATLTTVDGRKLPEQRYGAMDREFTRTSFQRFAESVAAALAGADQR